ncbi:MAG TPA: hypothetical protein VMW27_25030 [Thermoanaerobaculia bacterium]|nr:hypothetical protein [Thermoanaerobaculia bacterium]
MARFLDLESWPRRQTSECFRGFDKPYFNICTSLEAGPLVELVRSQPETSFFLAYLFGLTYFDYTEDFAGFQAAAREAMAQQRLGWAVKAHQSF